ncbi:putative membrane protein [Austwickia sp. TVS 96-490-7B]|uniref:DedA family protein n=1 Tax=Austwickia sp. TVS 96-490-7B TaxID=2830843 RepID=UPI001C57E6BF|nr:DedA family protein [Austwickia sp. TVS 96-490-7B]MBW3086179.1 putative membrane protein [Austwickia sp. TVS 96-490-7B]
MNVDEILQTIPAEAVYGVVGLVIGLESLGIPLPGEITLVAAALLSTDSRLSISPLWVAAAGATGAIVGDSIGYEIGKLYGYRLLRWLRRRFPGHINPETLAYATSVFHRNGPATVFFGRFIVLLRIIAGPLSGALKLPYRVFLPANALGGITWAMSMTYGVYYLGQVAEKAFQGVAWMGLLILVGSGVVTATLMRRRMQREVRSFAASHPDMVAAMDEATR